MFAAVSVRIRKIRNGTSGARTRVSVTTKTREQRDARRRAGRSCAPVPQPTSGAFEIA